VILLLIGLSRLERGRPAPHAETVDA
jgi:hypothetical protein